MLEVAPGPLGLPLIAAQVPGRGLDELQLRTLRRELRDGFPPVGDTRLVDDILTTDTSLLLSTHRV